MGFQTGLTGLNVFSKTLDVIGNNIANSNTVGMKATRTEYADLAAVRPGSSGGSGVGFGVAIATTAQQFTQGNFSVTGNALDLAINGNGFFQVVNPNGTKAYTRDGQFKVDKEGNLMTNSGANVMGYKTDKTGIPSSPVLPSKITVPSGAPIAASETKSIVAGLNLSNRAQFATVTTPATPVATYGTAVTAFDAQGTENPVSLYFSRGESVPENTAAGTPAKDVWYVYDSNTQIDGDIEVKATAAGSAPKRAEVVLAQTALDTAKLTSTTATSLNTTEATKTLAAGDLTFSNDANTTTADTVSGALIGLISTASTDADAARVAFDAAVAADAAAISAPNNAGLVSAAATTRADAITALALAKTSADAAKTQAAADLSAATIATGPLFQINTLSALVTKTTATATSAGNAITAFNKTGVTDKTGILTTKKSELALVSDSDLKRASALFKMEFTQDGKLSATYKNSTINPGSFTATETKGILSYAIDPTKSNPSSIVQPFNVSIDLAATTQFSDAFAVNQLTQDGYTSGSLTGLTVNNQGQIITNYSNGQTQVQGVLVLADFRNTQGLTNVGNGNYVETLLSGTPVLGNPGVGKFGDIRAGALEDSNVDLTGELVNMMVAQRNYQANAQTIKTQDQVLSTLVNLR